MNTDAKKDEIGDFLAPRPGGATEAEIIKHTGIPAGMLGALLKEMQAEKRVESTGSHGGWRALQSEYNRWKSLEWKDSIK